MQLSNNFHSQRLRINSNLILCTGPAGELLIEGRNGTKAFLTGELKDVYETNEQVIT